MSEQSSSRAIDQVMRFLENELSFEAGFYEQSYLDRRLRARLRRVDAATFGEYYQMLMTDTEEQEALLDTLSINVTEFFRNPPMWERLAELLSTLANERDHLRCWSAACADGREPYSLGMVVLDHPAIDESSIDIVATDIDPQAIERAKAGVYTTTRIVDIEDELSVIDRPERFVDRSGNRFEVTQKLRSMVEFQHHDLIRDDPPGTFDVVLCRNLLIYIAAAYKHEMFTTLIDSLRADGFLVIGMTETIPPSLTDDLHPHDRSHRIYRHR